MWAGYGIEFACVIFMLILILVLNHFCFPVEAERGLEDQAQPRRILR